MSTNSQQLKKRQGTIPIYFARMKLIQIFTVLIFLMSLVGPAAQTAQAAAPVGKYDWHLINASADNSFSDSFLPVNTIDDNADNIWLNDINDTLPTSIWYEFPAEETISKVGLWQASYVEPWSYRIQGYEIFVSTNGTDWTSVATNTGTDMPHAYQETSFTPVTAKFVKITAGYPGWEDQTYDTYDTKNWIGLDGFQAYDQTGAPLINSAPLLFSTYALTVSTVGSGSVNLNPPGGSYAEGTVVQVEAVPASGWSFSSWSGALSGNTNPTSISMSADKAITATFTETASTCYALTLSHAGSGSNPVASPAKSTACSANGQYVAGEAITLSGAVASAGWQIVGWTGTNNDASTEGGNSLTMPASPRTVSVVYQSTGPSVATPVVAVHVSEATSACWSSLGGPHNDWKYWHIYGFLMEALNSDGTPYVVVTDAQISAGNLLSGGKPKYPILISLAAACISDATATGIKDFVQAGGHVYAGSTAWTRNENGVLRGASGATGKYDWHLINVSADNSFSATYAPVNTIDDSVDNLWLNDINDTLPTSIWYELPAEETISKVGIWQASYDVASWSYRLRDYEIFVSTDGTTWTSVATNTGADVAHAYQETSFTPVIAKFVKITAKYPGWEDQTFETYDTKNWIGLDGFQAYDGSGNPLIDSAPLLSTSSQFALSSEMGLVPENTGLIGTIQKLADDPIVNHLKETDIRNWLLPKAYSSVGYSHPSHWAQFVTVTDATVLLASDGHPTIAVKNYGAGRFIYHSEFSPLAGYSGYVVDNFEYGFFRKAIEQAFKANGVPLVRLSGWPYPYNAAFQTRHDHFLRKDASDVEAKYNVKGEWLLRTATAINGPDWTYLNDIRANGALIGSHTLDETTLDSGAYSAAYTNINQSLNALATYLGTRPQIFVSPGMMAFRDTSIQAIVDNGIKTTGDMSHGPYPNFALKIDTATDYGDSAHWSVLEIPVSRYYAKPGETWGDLIYSHMGSMALTDELAYIDKTVDLTYDLGGVINLYDHIGDIGTLWIHPDVSPFEHYISYSLAKPYVWNTDPLRIYDWWMKRDAVSITPTLSYPTQDQTQVNVAVTGTANAGPFALDIAIPTGKGVSQVKVNNIVVTTYRVEGQKLKVSAPAPSQVEVLFGQPAAVACYALTLTATGQGSTPVASPANSTGCSAGQYVAGEIITLSGVAPETGWKINGWTGTNADSSLYLTNTVTMPASARTSGVVYTAISLDTTITSKPANPTPSAQANFTFTSTVAAATFECKLDDGNFEACTSPKLYTGLSEGEHTFQVRAINGLDVDPTPASYTWTISTVPLTTTLLADTYVQNDQPTTNYGTSGWFAIDAGPVRNAYLKFNVTGIGTRTVKNATLRLYNVESSVFGGNFYGVADTTWDEATVNWNTAPASDATSFASLGAVTTGTWYEVDVTSLVKGDGPFSLKITSTSGDGAYYSSKEGAPAFAPQLVITTSTGDVPTVTINQADSQADPTTVSPVHFTAVFSKAVTGFEGADVTLTGTAGATTAVISGGPITYDVAVSGMTADGTVIAEIPANKVLDASSNGNTASTSTDNSITYTIPPNCYVLTVGKTGQGATPTATPANSTGCSAGQYVAGATISLSGATPEAGWQIDGWSGTSDDSSTATTNTVTMPAHAQSVSVTYSQLEFTLTVNVVGSGSVTKSLDQAIYHYGDVVQLTATPELGWSLANWSGDLTGSTNPASITMDGSKTITAIFTQNEYTLTVTTVGSGSVTRNPNQVTYHYGDSVTLTAGPAIGWRFNGWSGGLSGSVNPATIVMDSNKSITALFSVISYNIDLLIGGVKQESYFVPPQGSMGVDYSGMNNGPVKIQSTNGAKIVASERVAYSPDGGTTWTSHSEILGFPSNQVTNSYTFPWYNNVDLNTQLRFGNVGTANTTVTVTVGGQFKGSYLLKPNESTRVSYKDLSAGPVKVTSSGNVPIIASMRVAYLNAGEWTSFSEMMGLPSSKLTTSYTFPWYNNVDLNSQLRFGNVGNVNTTVTVTIGGQFKGSYLLKPNESTRVNYASLSAGPVKVTSSGNVPIIASMRVAYLNAGKWTDFSEMMGVPTSSLSTSYSFPVYNNVDYNTQLRFGNAGATTTTVTVTVGGVLQGSYTLAPNASQRVSYKNLNSGPVVIQSSGNVPIIASVRVAYFDTTISKWTSFAEMMGLPKEQLTTSYLFPWYNNVDLNTQLRFGIP